jgi:hypothetical protein
MNNIESCDQEIKKLKLYYDLSAYNTQKLDLQRKSMEVRKNEIILKNQSDELATKIKATEDAINML